MVLEPLNDAIDGTDFKVCMNCFELKRDEEFDIYECAARDEIVCKACVGEAREEEAEVSRALQALNY